MELKTGFPPEEVYYRIYKQTRWPFWMTIVCLQWFDEWNYEKENFVRNVDDNPYYFESEDDARKMLNIWFQKYRIDPNYVIKDSSREDTLIR